MLRDVAMNYSFPGGVSWAERKSSGVPNPRMRKYPVPAADLLAQSHTRTGPAGLACSVPLPYLRYSTARVLLRPLLRSQYERCGDSARRCGAPHPLFVWAARSTGYRILCLAGRSFWAMSSCSALLYHVLCSTHLSHLSHHPPIFPQQLHASFVSCLALLVLPLVLFFFSMSLTPTFLFGHAPPPLLFVLLFSNPVPIEDTLFFAGLRIYRRLCERVRESCIPTWMGTYIGLRAPTPNLSSSHILGSSLAYSPTQPPPSPPSQSFGLGLVVHTRKHHHTQPRQGPGPGPGTRLKINSPACPARSSHISPFTTGYPARTRNPRPFPVSILFGPHPRLSSTNDRLVCFDFHPDSLS
ncbi:uncharacterized protein CLUP02_06066 [Colletotrichum lupini]|uniref:Uncharacterized protein n=1 Tax=Colletotrichum lupini TaxID=145971 RepID=A0A9Q8SNZ6_9PEZI|nr:uncharacterized protein CLUP02_06066 [Colletotrichum lupini]UQC80583.1 hypothetical protein CLUP02_06066 [Colletotrichum lupini]